MGKKLPFKTTGSLGASTHGCIAIVVILVLIAGGLYIFYFREHGLQFPGSSINIVKQTTTQQKKDYLKGVKKQYPAMSGIGRTTGEFITGVKSGAYKTQSDINIKAADIENRIESIIYDLKRLKTPAEFADGQKMLMSSFSSYNDCLKKLRKINSSAIAGNLDMIDQNLRDIESACTAGNEKLSSGINILRRKQSELKLGNIL